MKTEIEQIKELLELGCYLGPGERYLMLYEGILTITNRTGLAYWPKGKRRIIVILDGSDCVGGLRPDKLDEIVIKLGKLNAVTDIK